MKRASSNEPIPVPQEEDVLPANSLTKSKLESTPHLSSKQCKPVDPEPTRFTSPDSDDEGLQANDDTPGPLRQSSRKTRNQLPLRYWNFAAWQNDSLPSTLDLWVGLCICLHILSCLYSFCEEYTVKTLLKPSQVCQTQMIFAIGGDTTNLDSMVDFWMGGVDKRICGPSTIAPLGKPKDSPQRLHECLGSITLETM